jgi:hypothetical protein
MTVAFRLVMSLRGWVAICVSLSLSLSTGCTLVGAGVGAAVDANVPGPYDTRPGSAYVRFKPKDRVMVWLGNGKRVEGRYLGVIGPTRSDPETYLIIDADSKPELVRASEVKTLGVEVSGRGWLYGGLIGLAVDVTLVVLLMVHMSNNMKLDWSHSNGPEWGR